MTATRRRQRLEEVRQALETLGGTAHLSDIYAVVRMAAKQSPPERKVNVRSTLGYYSSDSKTYGGTKDVFQHVGPKRSGMWRLRRIAE